MTLPEKTNWITRTNGMIVMAATESFTKAEIVSDIMSAPKVIRNMVKPISTMRELTKSPSCGNEIPMRWQV